MFLRSVSWTFTIVERRALCCASDPHRCSQWMWFSHRNIQRADQPGPSTESDLATALHRLSLRRQNYLSEKQFFAEEWQRKIQVLADQKEEGSGCGTPTESLASLYTDQSEITDPSSASCLRGFMPEKLQIVKPLEGNKWGPFLSDVAYHFAFPWKWHVSYNYKNSMLYVQELSLLSLNLHCYVTMHCRTLWKINEEICILHAISCQFSSTDVVFIQMWGRRSNLFLSFAEEYPW